MSLKVGDICIIDRKNISKNTESHPVEVVITKVYGFIIKQYCVAMIDNMGHVRPEPDMDNRRIYGHYLHKIKQHDNPVAIRFPAGMPSFSTADLELLDSLRAYHAPENGHHNPYLLRRLDILNRKICFYASDDLFGRDDRETVANSRDE